MKTVLSVLFLVAILVGSVAHTQESEYQKLPNAMGYVSDFSDVLNKKEEKKLTKIIKQHKRRTTNEIAVVTIDSLYGYSDLSECSLTLARKWGVGTAEKNNGVLIALYIPGRKIWIQNGTGLEEKIANAETRIIIDNIITPEFAKGDYYSGLEKGIEAIIEEIE